MDIRMPFDDDIEKSKLVGMNAHLAKTIEPERIYQTLYDFMFGTEAPECSVSRPILRNRIRKESGVKKRRGLLTERADQCELIGRMKLGDGGYVWVKTACP